ncbi:hypothetical protein B484DRAFT_132413 [Ochromonadaceae sp. CCMP2298]|nr:hypothetical protein B484DRAFT_132413 [Ochromonadaceae sp. CCMP2298]
MVALWPCVLARFAELQKNNVPLFFPLFPNFTSPPSSSISKGTHTSSHAHTCSHAHISHLQSDPLLHPFSSTPSQRCPAPLSLSTPCPCPPWPCPLCLRSCRMVMMMMRWRTAPRTTGTWSRCWRSSRAPSRTSTPLATSNTESFRILNPHSSLLTN